MDGTQTDGTHQFTVFQIDDYGPWTVTPAPRREMDLQVLQSRLYADVASFVGARGGYAFYARGDNVIAATDGVDRADHETLQATLRNRYPVTVSAGIGRGPTPRAAVAAASDRLQAAGSAQDAARTGVTRGAGGEVPDGGTGPVHVAHFDVVDATGRVTDRRDAFGAYRAVTEWYGRLADLLYDDHGALAFFVGGDNAIAVCPALSRGEYRSVVDRVDAATALECRVGVGAGETARVAGRDAKHALERAREREARVVAAADEAPPDGEPAVTGD